MKTYSYNELSEDQQYLAACLHEECQDPDIEVHFVVNSIYKVDTHGIPYEIAELRNTPKQ